MNLLKELYKETNKGKGFPVASVFYNGYKKIFAVSNTKFDSTKEWDDKTRHENHAEFIGAKFLESTKEDRVCVLITLPPCEKCLLELKNLNKIKKIYYLFDPWGKVNRNYIKSTKDIKIEKFERESEYVDLIWGIFEKKIRSFWHRFSYKRLLKKQKTKKLRRFLNETTRND